MTREDRQALEGTLRAFEQLYFRNMGLETLLEKFGPPNWSRLADELANDERLYPDIRERFRRAYEDLQQSTPDELLALLLSLRAQGKPN